MEANKAPRLSNSNGQTFAAGRAIRRPARMARREMGNFAQVPDRRDTQRLYHLRQYIALAVAFLGRVERKKRACRTLFLTTMLAHTFESLDGLTALNTIVVECRLLPRLET